MKLLFKPKPEPEVEVYMARSEKNDSEENNRRIALRKIFVEAGYNVTSAARHAGFSSPNFLYNYLNGGTKRLSADMIDRLNNVFPGVAAALLDLPSKNEEVGAQAVRLKMSAQAGTLLASGELPIDRQVEIAVPVNDTARVLGAFAVLLKSPGFELVYPTGTILVAMPIGRTDLELKSGSLVILQRVIGQKIEITLREISVDDGKAWLISRTKNPVHQVPISMPWPSDGTRSWKSEKNDRLSLAGIVIGAYIKLVEDQHL